KPISPAERRARARLGAEIVLCVRRGHQLAAFIALGEKRSGDVYTPGELSLLRTALEKVSGELLRLDLGQNVPAQVLDLMARDPKRLQPTSQEITVLHAALSGPPAVPAERVARPRQEAVDAIAAVVGTQEGLLDAALGGVLQALWNAPVRVGDHAPRACRAALAMRDAVAALAPRWSERGCPVVELRVGVTTGTAMVGNVPRAERFHYTAEGPCWDLPPRSGSQK